LWGTESPDAVQALTQAYSKVNSNIRVEYTRFSQSEYNSKLLNALAAGQGPDLFFVQSHELPVSLIAPAPETQFTLSQVQTLFPKIVEQDFAPDGKVYALPLYLDSLALIYNKTIFDRSGVVSPPVTWNDFENLSANLRVLDDQGRIKKAGAAIGGSLKSIAVAPDILELLMLQNGTQMIDTTIHKANFSSAPGQTAFDFYVKFADAADENYTWDDSGPDSLDSFAAGNTVMLLDYASRLAQLKNKNPYLDIGIAPVPQVSSDNPVDFSEYQGLAVSRQSKNISSAWDFVVQSSTNADVSGAYLSASGRPPALRSIIGKTVNSAFLGVFARAALIARSWYYAQNSQIQNILSQAIQKTITGGTDSRTALKDAENSVTQIVNAP
jgi:multiple sugar transport system substrate-binding protein